MLKRPCAGASGLIPHSYGSSLTRLNFDGLTAQANHSNAIAKAIATRMKIRIGT